MHLMHKHHINSNKAVISKILQTCVLPSIIVLIFNFCQFQVWSPSSKSMGDLNSLPLQWFPLWQPDSFPHLPSIFSTSLVSGSVKYKNTCQVLSVKTSGTYKLLQKKTVEDNISPLHYTGWVMTCTEQTVFIKHKKKTSIDGGEHELTYSFSAIITKYTGNVTI